jgi:hypothetical protein
MDSRESNAVCRILHQLSPVDRLLERAVQHGVCVSDGAGREFAFKHLMVSGLNSKRSQLIQVESAESRSDVAGKKRRIIRIALRTQLGLGGEGEPSVEVLIQSLRANQFPALLT